MFCIRLPHYCAWSTTPKILTCWSEDVTMVNWRCLTHARVRRVWKSRPSKSVTRTLFTNSYSLPQRLVYTHTQSHTYTHTYTCIHTQIHIHTHTTGSDVFSTSTDGQVLWWDIRKLVEPVETLPLEFAGYKSGSKLGGIVVEYESTMVYNTYNVYTIQYNTIIH